MLPPPQPEDAASVSVLIPSLQIRDRLYESSQRVGCKAFSSLLPCSRHERDEQCPSRSIRLTVPYAENLETVPHPDLNLSRIAEPIPNRPIKVEQQRRRRRIPEIVAIQNVEYFNQRLELTAPSQTEWFRQPDIPAGEGIVAPDRIAEQNRSIGADSVRRRCRPLPARLVVDALLRCRLRRVE